MAAGGVGYYGTGYWHANWWNDEYWAEAGAVPPPPPPPPVDVETGATPGYAPYERLTPEQIRNLRGDALSYQAPAEGHPLPSLPAPGVAPQDAVQPPSAPLPVEATPWQAGTDGIIAQATLASTAALAEADMLRRAAIAQEHDEEEVTLLLLILAES